MIGRTLLIAGLATLAGGCGASRSDYPSLLPRPIEQRSEAEPAPAPPPVAVPDPVLDARIAKARQDRAAQARRFDQLAGEADHLATAARGAKAGDERWIAAQSALAEVEAVRAAALERVSDLEQAAGDRGLAGEPAYPSLDAELAAQRQELSREQDRTAAIAKRLPSS